MCQPRRVADQPLATHRRCGKRDAAADAGASDNREAGRRRMATAGAQSNYKQPLGGRRSVTATARRGMRRRASRVLSDVHVSAVRGRAADNSNVRAMAAFWFVLVGALLVAIALARAVSRPPAGEPGDDLPRGGLPARPGGLQCARAASAARAHAARVHHRDRAADRAVHRGHQDARADRRLALERAAAAGHHLDGGDHPGHRRRRPWCSWASTGAWRWCSARCWRPPIRCSPPTCNCAARRIATACASGSRARAASTMAPRSRSCC